MRILYINPNSTSSMTEAVATCARKALPADCEVLGWTNHHGPPAIQGPADGEAALPGLLARLDPAREAGVDAIVIACFDDTGLEALRAAAHCPVLGIGQAAYAMAALLGGPFAVVTTLAVSVPVIAGNIERQGFARHCAAIRPTGLPVLEVEAGGARVLERIGQQIALAARASVVRECRRFITILPELPLYR
jgi:allantoin racemase